MQHSLDELYDEERILIAMVRAEQPLVFCSPLGGPLPPNLKMLALRLLGDVLQYGAQSRCFHVRRPDGSRSFSWAKLVREELRYIWWHREAFVTRYDIEFGNIGVRLIDDQMPRPGLQVDFATRQWGEIN